MGDIKNPNMIILKGLLFLVLGCLAGGSLIAHVPSLQNMALLGITVWAFCRFYYFAFYVIEHYVDAEYKFAGLSSVVVYLVQRRSKNPSGTTLLDDEKCKDSLP